ncbi:hypothetical protein PROFUN_08294 [Planoprotostelium fungivorum]|uniref:Uncharacterized protein n=1 Tax=Planoprotostelium fungivorum TaxID=1890364 RepID=A0A2P6NK02_9EUKA|nr:hypothetical protein PROFUN_08294 [Planoprotostelium fungivorum]
MRLHELSRLEEAVETDVLIVPALPLFARIPSKRTNFETPRLDYPISGQMNPFAPSLIQ